MDHEAPGSRSLATTLPNHNTPSGAAPQQGRFLTTPLPQDSPTRPHHPPLREARLLPGEAPLR